MINKRIKLQISRRFRVILLTIGLFLLLFTMFLAYITGDPSRKIDCDGVFVIPFEGGIKKGICIDIENMKKNIDKKISDSLVGTNFLQSGKKY